MTPLLAAAISALRHAPRAAATMVRDGASVEDAAARVRTDGLAAALERWAEREEQPR